MANLSITSACNRHCPYCFARDSLSRLQQPQAHMSRRVFLEALSFLERSDMRQVRLLGGEPTLHPDFNEMASEVLRRGMNLLVFSNGLMGRDVLRHLDRIPEKQLRVLINVFPPSLTPAGLVKKQGDAFRSLGRRAMPGLNIHAPALAHSLDFLLELVKKFDLSPAIRLGLAHPNLEGNNVSLNPKYYPVVGEGVMLFLEKAEKENIRVEFDCGFVPCMFARVTAGRSLAQIAAAFACRCNPILDILPDGAVISCYALSAIHREPIPKRGNARGVGERFQEKLAVFKRVGIFRECADCLLAEQNVCVRGCRAVAIRRLHHLPFSFSWSPGQRVGRGNRHGE